jgi:hypothetical protein
MSLTSLLAIVILLRILFIITESKNNSFKPAATQNLRTLQYNIVAYQFFKNIHKNIIMVSAVGGKEYNYNLCLKDPIINTIDEMVREAFPDCIINKEQSHITNCTSYKIHW